jgi:Zn-finger nucleic acid-binding protein
MHCPACADELRPTDLQGVGLERCPRCEGAWLDRDGLHCILERSRPGTVRTEPAAAPRGQEPGRWPPDVPFYDFG